MEYRLIRVPLPVNIVLEVDDIVASGRGGYETRAHFIREAVEALAAEVKYGLAEPGIGNPLEGADAGSVATRELALRGNSSRTATATELSILGPVPEVRVVERGEAEVADDYLFGLHNRDYPTLWAARRLAELTTSDLVPIDDFYRLIADQAWAFGERLLPIELESGQKLTALFPTNRAKPESSESAFMNFAVGSHSNGDVLRAQGPIYVWRLAQLVWDDGTLMIGLTPSGLDLLDGLAEITIETPHSQVLAETFFAHLRRFAPTDWQGFEQTLTFLAEGVRRSQLVEAISSAHPEWTETVAATNAAGYVARSREWGLVSRRQVQGRYELTDYGRKLIEDEWGGQK